ARLPARRNGSERGRAALPERALERAVLPQRLVAGAARGAGVRERADAAAWDPSQADGGAEVEQRLRAGGIEGLAGALLDAAHVRVDRQHVAAEREVPDRRCGVRPDARQLRQVVRPPVDGDCAGGAVEVDRAAVVAEPLPL